MELPKRGSITSCPKCGVTFSEDEPKHIAYRQDFEFTHTGMFDWREPKVISETEYILLACSTCNYTWREKCADA